MSEVVIRLAQKPGVEVPEESEDAIRRVLELAAQPLPFPVAVNVLLTDQNAIKELNDQFRHVDSVTDVLSFPATEFDGLLVAHVQNGGDVVREDDGVETGDIAICVERAGEQAESLGHSLVRELQFLAAHGFLHLLGYDHMTAGDEAVMTALQRDILGKVPAE